MKINKAFFIFPLIVLGLLALTILYFQNIFLPIKLKEIVSQKSKDLINRELSVGQVNYSLLKGFTIQDVKLFEKGAPREEFITAKEISFQILLPALFKNQKIIIPSISIKNPYVSIIRHTDKSFNLSDLFEKFSGPSPKASPALFLGRLSLTGGQINFTDQNSEGEVTQQLLNISVKANLSMKGSVEFTIGGQIRDDAEPFPTVDVHGTYYFSDKKLDLTSNIATLPSRYFHWFLPEEQVKNFEFLIQTAAISLSLKDQTLSASGTLDLSGPEYHSSRGAAFASHLMVSQFHLKKNKSTWQIQADWTGTESYFQPNNYKPQLFDVTASNFILTKDDARTEIQGDFSFNNIKVNMGYAASGGLNIRGGQIQIEDTSFNFAAALSSKKIYLKYKDDIFDGALDSPKTQISLKDNILSINGQYHATGADLRIFDKFQITGDFASNLSLKLSPDAMPVYQGELEFQKATLTGLPAIKNMSNIEGTIAFTNNTLETQRLSFDTLGSAFTISGTAQDFKDPQVDVRFNSNHVDLEKIFVLATFLNKDLALSPSGSASIEGRFHGKTAQPQNAQITFKSELNNASLQGSLLPFPITGMTGTLAGNNTQLTFENLKGTVLKNDYTLSGTLNDFENPNLDITLVSSNINLTSQLKISDDPVVPSKKMITINTMRGYYLNTPLDVQGFIAFKNDTAQLNLEGHTDLELKDLTVLLPQLTEKIKTINPNGVLKTNFSVYGPLNSWTDWDISLDSHSEELLLWGLKFGGVDLTFDQKDKKINNCSLTAKLYDGDLSLSSSADLEDEDFPFDLTMSLDNTNLEKLKNDTGLKNRPLSGKISSSLNLSGHLKDGSGLNGDGTLSAQDGNLAQMTIFKGLINAMLPKEFQSVNFTNGTMGFEIQERKVSTTNLTLISEQVTLVGRGHMDFEQNIHFLIEPKFSEIALSESQSLGSPVASVMNIANQFVDMEVTGTLSKPVFTPKPRPGKVLNKVKDVLIEGLENIFQ